MTCTKLPPSERYIDYERLDQGKDDECLGKAQVRRRRFCPCRWRRQGTNYLPGPPGGGGSSSADFWDKTVIQATGLERRFQPKAVVASSGTPVDLRERSVLALGAFRATAWQPPRSRTR